MISFKNKTAIVTGAGSGIGLALSKALVKRGAEVWLTDVNENAVKDASSKLGANAHSALLDVRDAAAIKQLVAQVVAKKGSLDFLFNNAGIGIGGEMQNLGVEHFDRIIDVNIRGVMNGIAAAYPLMVKQGQGCIVNTASAAGLMPSPLLTAYSMSKHAIVGLSRSLRIEGERYGIQVNALCPAAVDTPLLDSTGPSDLPTTETQGVRKYLTKLAPAYPADKFATYVLDGLVANKEIIIAPHQARKVALLFRFFPGVVLRNVKKLLNYELKKRSRRKA